MTVKELFLSVGFNKIADVFKSLFHNEKSTGNLAGYKQAFDEICSLDFIGEGGEVTFEVTPENQLGKEGYLPLLANNVEGDYWQNTIGKTVIPPAEDNPFTDAGLAAAILWGMTFYGFSRHNRWKPIEEHFTSYGERAQQLELKLFRPYIRDKETIKELKDAGNFPADIGSKC